MIEVGSVAAYLALILSVYNFWREARKPARERQVELRNEYRDLLYDLRGECQHALTHVQFSQLIPLNPTEAIGRASGQLVKIAESLQSPNEDIVKNFSTWIQAVASHWMTLTYSVAYREYESRQRSTYSEAYSRTYGEASEAPGCDSVAKTQNMEHPNRRYPAVEPPSSPSHGNGTNSYPDAQWHLSFLYNQLDRALRDAITQINLQIKIVTNIDKGSFLQRFVSQYQE